MNEAIIAAFASVIVGTLSLIGVIVTNNRANEKMQSDMSTRQAVTDEKITELTRAVREHNDFAKRIPVIQEQIKVANNRIANLENFHKLN